MTRQQMKWLALAVILLVFGISKLALINWYLKHRTTPATPVELACHNLGAPCALPDGGQLVFVTPPSNGRPFVMRITGVADKEPTVEFAMVDMDMGFNRYRFVADGAAWQARVTLPVCVTGSRRWLATFHIGEHIYRLPFVTTG
ncbi:MAG TPA: hypothetical protein VJ642_03165 [Chromobacteriaceae bacterium]|nr:hypothetical protein [Chromobacteriaceae bacterium]